MPDSHPLRASRRFPVATVVIAAIGTALLVASVRQAGWENVQASFRGLGGWLPVVVLLGAVRMAIRATAWRLCSRAEGEGGIPFRDAFKAVLAADAVGNLTPLGLLASEPTKIVMARRHVSTIASVTSVTVENGFYTVSVVAMLLAGTWVMLQRAAVPPALERLGEWVVVGSLVGLAVALWMFRARPALLSGAWRAASRWRRQPNGSAEAAVALEERIYDVVHWPLGRLAAVGACEAIFHVAAVAEVWIVLRALPGGAATSLVDAFLLEATGRFITVAFKFIPYRLGIDEMGSGSVAQFLGLGAPAGVALAFVRRVRILILNAVGVVILARHKK